MRIISFSQTWPQYCNTDPAAGATKCVTRRFKTVWFDGESYYPTLSVDQRMADGFTFWKEIIPSWWDHRRDEPTLKPGEVFDGVEWSPRVGPRWCCSGGFVGGKAPVAGWLPHGDEILRCKCGNDLEARDPQRGVLSRHIETQIVTLGDDDGCEWCWESGDDPVLQNEKCRRCGGGGSAEAAREGFPGLSWQQFLEKCFPKVPPQIEVARIHFQRI